MASRRLFLASLCGLLSAGRLRAADPPALGGDGLARSFDLKTQLEKALKARQPKDFVFIAKVVEQVNSGKLPRTLVDQTLGYARNKSSKYPLVYFEFALRKQAAKIGVAL